MILDEIIAHKRIETAGRKQRVSLSDLVSRAEQQPATIDFATALRGEGIGLIAEIKRASPSKGSFAPDLQVESVASTYARNGAAAISVLTDEHYFSGGLGDLDDNNQVDLQDLDALVNLLVAAGPPFIVTVGPGHCGDIDENGQVDLQDLDALVNLLVGAGPPFIVSCE